MTTAKPEDYDLTPEEWDQIEDQQAAQDEQAAEDRRATPATVMTFRRYEGVRAAKAVNDQRTDRLH